MAINWEFHSSGLPNETIGVTQPRSVYPGETTMAQKRCYGQQFRLQPDLLVRRNILYVPGYLSIKYELLLHEYVVLSNHDHVVATDPEGQRPAFIRLHHSLVARAVNGMVGDTDALWSSQRHSALRLLDGEYVVRPMRVFFYQEPA